MSLIKVTTCKQPVQTYEVKYNDKNPYNIGRLCLEIGNNSGIDRHSGLHRYLLDEGKYAWLPAKEKLIWKKRGNLFCKGIVEYHLETLSAGHPFRLGYDSKEIFV